MYKKDDMVNSLVEQSADVAYVVTVPATVSPFHCNCLEPFMEKLILVNKFAHKPGPGVVRFQKNCVPYFTGLKIF
jgi:hypothetical protein